MGGGGGGGNARELDQTPTWAVASVCGVIVIISILLEKGLHHVGEFFSHRKKKAMVEALEKVKAELMVLGFISLLLVFGQNYIIKICISNHHLGGVVAWAPPYYAGGGAGHHSSSRVLAEANMATKCPDGKVSLISINALHQLHIFIFFLAVFHVSYSAITMALGRAKIRAWKEWEKEAAGQDYEFSNDPTRFRFTHETSFVRQHMNVLNKTPASFYISNFFRQFFRSVRKADYCALRHSFVNVHLAPGSKFDFQKYIKRSLEDDFKVIVGISPPLWASALIFLLLNVNGWHTMLWISIMPVVIILSVGTKLQGIICRMAIDITERHAVIQGIPLVQVSDSYFWFARPTFVLFLIHFTLFQNGFQIIYFLWILYEYGMDSCFNDSEEFVFARLCLGVVVQVLCSYVTLPLYALVSQMGSTMKQSIFDEQTSKALKNWRAGVKKKAGPTSSKHGGQGGGSPAGGSPTKADTDNKGDAAATGLQAGAAKKAAGQEGDDYEFIKIDE
ncbi:MLO-like protein 9 isoform X2 [Panicum virgatum]|uniref:MLO-like protein 9 isoform X2 n=1 Tax=Panicum virgatum TaxID=38727 RepID=UPI0019D67FFD|nr:MLO-like protein 9 isoform X2 [Panicum virgatum]